MAAEYIYLRTHRGYPSSMCGGVSFWHDGAIRKVYFPQPDAQLPIKLKNQFGGQPTERLYLWGRREREAGHLPITGWARLESIKSGKWDRFQPIPVKITVDQFMEKDHKGNSHWFGINPGLFIQGALVHWNDELRVYVVTSEPPNAALAALHDRFPRLVGDPARLEEFFADGVFTKDRAGEF